MGFFQRLGASVGATVHGYNEARAGNPLENPAIPLGGPGFWAWLFSGDVTESGESVNDFTALQHITVYRCVRIIAESVASLPVKLYERVETGRREAVDHRIYDMLRYEPNPEMTAVSYFECQAGCLALTGNCYAQIQRNKLGQAMGCLPLHPHKTKPVRVKNELVYETYDGMPQGQTRRIAKEDMLHVPLWSIDGILGLSPIMQAKQTVGLARAAEKYGARFFGNGSRPGGVLSSKTGARVDEKTLSQIRESWLAMQGGVNQGKTAVLPGEWNYQQIGLSPEESQFLETRKFTRADIAGLFGVAPHMVGDTSRLSNSNHEQQSLQFVTDTLRPYLCKFEQEYTRKLLPATGRSAGRYFLQHDVSERLRGDFQTTMQGYGLGRQWGFLSANKILEDMGENPIGPQGDIYLAPQNMQNLENLLPENGGGAPAPKAMPNTEIPNSEGESKDGQGEEKSLRFALAYISLFRDGVGRVCKRGWDQKVISTIFEPVLTSLAMQLRDVCGSKFGLSDGWVDASGVARERLTGIIKRAAAWNSERVDEIAMTELRQAVRGMAGELAEKAAKVAAAAV